MSTAIEPRAEIEVPIVSTNGINTVSLDFTGVFVAESRAHEISAVTPSKSGELLSLFNRAYLDLSNMNSQLRLHKARAEDAVNKIKARLLLDEVGPALKAKGVASSADTRQAYVDLNPEYCEAKERLDFIEATLEYVKGKMKFMENAYTAVKKILGENAWNLTNRSYGDNMPEGSEAGKTIRNGMFGDALE